ncbi:MAG: CorA family divalent cation transporter, partial [Gammaproteobacteria bacterium]
MRDRQNDDGIIQAFVLDGKGGGVPLGWNEIRAWKPGQGVLWLHLDYTSDAARRWIQQESGLDGIVGEALLSEETRPRATFIDGAALLALRGVNLNPGADPEDMVSIRIWLDKDRIVSTRKRRMLSATDIAEALASGDGPKSPGEFIAQLTQRLTARMEHIVEDLEDRAAQLEEEVISGGSAALRNALSAIRRDTIMLRRYLAP